MGKHLRTFVAGTIPALLALVVVWMEPVLSAWVKERESALPVMLMLLLGALLHPRFRNMLVVSLCYGVAFMALRDIMPRNHIPLPPSMDYLYIDELRTGVLILVSGLAATAAIGETIKPGTVWARRCYFGAASLYFTALGAVNVVWHPSWQSFMLCGTGIIALFGCIFSDRIIAAEDEEETILVSTSDEVAQRERDTAHRLALVRKEWRDNLTSEDTEKSLNISNGTA